MIASPDSRQNNFDALRLIAATFVVFGHAYALTVSGPPPVIGNTGIHTFGVKIFFSISGYLVAKSWMSDPNVTRYVWRRSLRIFPALIVIILASMLLLGPALTTLPSSDYFAGARIYLWNLLLYPVYSLPGVYASNPYPHAVNGSLWSLPVEFSMYVLLPIILLLAAWGGRWLAVAITIGLLIVGAQYRFYAPPADPWVIYGTPVLPWLEVTPLFMVGAVVALYTLERFLSLPVAFVAFMLLGVMARLGVPGDLLISIAVPYAMLSFALCYERALRIPARIGDLSYGVFLYSFPVQQMIVQAMGVSRGPIHNFVVAMLLVLPLAFASWHLVEKRALRLKPPRTSAAKGREPIMSKEAMAMSEARRDLGAPEPLRRTA